MLKKIAMFFVGIALLSAGFALATEQSATVPGPDVASISANMRAGRVTVGWLPDPKASGGYALIKDGKTVAVAGPKAARTRFSVAAGIRTLEVRELSLSASTATTVTSTVTGTTTASTSTAATTTTPTASCSATINPGSGLPTAASALAPGQTLCLHGGNYTVPASGYGWHITAGGTPSAAVTVRSFPGETATIVDNATGGPSFNLVTIAAPYVILNNLRFDGGGVTIKIISGHDTVSNSEISNHRAGASCVLLGGSEGRATDTVLSDNRIHGCGSNGTLDHCIYDGHSDRAVIQRNVFYSCQAYGIQLYPDAQGTLFDHNTVDGANSTRGGVIFGGESAPVSSNNTVSNNVLTYATGYELSYYWGGASGTGNIASHNCLWGASSGDVTSQVGFSVSGSIHADPLFVNRSGGNYSLQSGSLCAGLGA